MQTQRTAAAAAQEKPAETPVKVEEDTFFNMVNDLLVSLCGFKKYTLEL
jgi:hypothetical protein